MLDIQPIPAFQDNYIWLIKEPNSKQCVAVDPGDATPVLAYLKTHRLNLTEILITHHHNDHTGGILRLKKATNAAVYGPNSDKIAGLDHIVKEGDVLTLQSLNITLKVIEVPGHTLDHVVYYGNDILFSGDTLFGGGCGRVLEGTPSQLFESLHKLISLPDSTRIYCAHEYTLQNLNFGKTIEPNNQEIDHRKKAALKLRCAKLPTVPSTMGLEKKTNVFLRCKSKAAFTMVRNLKDQH